MSRGMKSVAMLLMLLALVDIGLRAVAQVGCAEPPCRIYLPLIGGQLFVERADDAPEWVEGPSALPGVIEGLFAGANAVFAMGRNAGGNRFWSLSNSSGQWIPVDGRERDSNLGFSVLAVGPSGDYWISDFDRASGEDRLIHAGTDRRRIEVVPISAEGLPGGRVKALAIQEDGTLWVGTGEGLARRTSDGRWSQVALPAAYIHNVGDIALASDGGAWLALIPPFEVEAPRPWGLVYLGPDGRSQYWSTGDIVGDPLRTEPWLAMDRVGLSPGGRVYVQGELGLYSGDGRGSWSKVDFMPDAGLVDSPDIGRAQLAFDRTGQLWVFSSREGLARVDTTNDQVERITVPELSNARVRDLAIDPRSGDLELIAVDPSNSGPFLLQRTESGSVRRTEFTAVHGDLVSDSPVRLALTPDGTAVVTLSRDRLLIRGPTASGYWEPQDRLTYRDGGGGANGCVDPSGRFWFVYAEGISSYNGTEGWRHLRSADGLPLLSGSFNFCAPDGALWLAPHTVNAGEAALQRWVPGAQLERQDERLGLGAGESVAQLAWSAEDRLAALVRAAGPSPNEGPWLVIAQADGTYRRYPTGAAARTEATDLLWSSDGTVWLATTGGLASLKPGALDDRPTWVDDSAVAGRKLWSLVLHDGAVWAVGSEGAAERLPDGTWRGHTQADGLSSADLVQAVEALDGELWLLDRGGMVNRLIR